MIGLGTATSTAASSAGDLAANTAAAGAAAAKAVMGFDELNKVSSAASGASDAGTSDLLTGGVTIPAVSTITGPKADFSKWFKTFDDIKAKLDAFKTAFKPLLDGFYAIAKFLIDNPNITADLTTLAIAVGLFAGIPGIGPIVVAVSLIVGAMELASGYSMKDVADALASTQKGKGAFNGLGDAVGKWILDAIWNGVINQNSMKEGSFGDRFETCVMDTWNVDSTGVKGLLEIGVNIAIAITNGIMEGLAQYLGPVNTILASLGAPTITVPNFAPVDFSPNAGDPSPVAVAGGVFGVAPTVTKKKTTTTTNKISAAGAGMPSNLPHYAQGGYIKPNYPQIVAVGDNRTEGEIIAPESKIAQAVRTGMRGSGGGLSKQDMLDVLRQVFSENPNTVIVDGRVVATSGASANNMMSRQYGKAVTV